MVHYGEAIKRPFTDFLKLIIGIALSILPIVNFFTIGYHLECARTAKKKKFALPKWKGMWEYFVQGFFASIIGLIYSIPLVIYAIYFFGKIVLSVIAGNIGVLAAITQAVGVFVGLVLLFLLTTYVVVSATLEYAFTNKFGAAFSGNVFNRLGTKQFFVPWLVGSIIYGVVFGLLAGVPVVGGAIAAFVGGVTYYTLMGEAYD